MPPRSGQPCLISQEGAIELSLWHPIRAICDGISKMLFRKRNEPHTWGPATRALLRFVRVSLDIDNNLWQEEKMGRSDGGYQRTEERESGWFVSWQNRQVFDRFLPFMFIAGRLRWRHPPVLVGPLFETLVNTFRQSYFAIGAFRAQWDCRFDSMVMYMCKYKAAQLQKELTVVREREADNVSTVSNLNQLHVIRSESRWTILNAMGFEIKYRTKFTQIFRPKRPRHKNSETSSGKQFDFWRATALQVLP